MRRFLPLFITIVFLSASCTNNGGKKIRGEYQTVSESEWQIMVIISPKKKAQIIIESWEPGRYDERDFQKIEASWQYKDKKIFLYYSGITDILIYDDELSLREIGFEGSAPGIKPVAPYPKGSILDGYSLWKMPHDFKK